MYQVRPAENDRFSIFDEQGNVLFTGALRECEMWLDLHENLQATPSWFRRSVGPFTALGRKTRRGAEHFIRALFGHKTDSVHEAGDE
jgi:hypothetical protein